MPTLFLVDGAAGAGKSEILNYCNKRDHSTTCICKYTNKDEDKEDYKREDLIYSTQEELTKIIKENRNKYYSYFYPKTSQVEYVVLKSQIDENLRKFKNVFLIVRDEAIISKIKEDYSKYINVNVVTVFVYCDETKAIERIKEQCKTKGVADSREIQNKINDRIARNKECLKAYTSAIGGKLYEHVILNDIEIGEYHACIDKLINIYKDFDEKFSKLKTFIIMPITDGREWAHFNEVKKAIIDGAKEQGFEAWRQDDRTVTSNSIMDGIQESINEAVCCVGDITLSKPNCFYEIGLAEEHHSKQAIILLQEKGETTEFDLRGRNIHEYSYGKGYYQDIARQVSTQLEMFKKEFIFMTEDLEQAIKDQSKKN